MYFASENASAALKSLARCPILLRFLPCICIFRNKISLINELSGRPRLHWTNQPCKWHINDGEEIFAVLNGSVEMFYKEDGAEKSSILNAGDIFFASIGTEHVAHPIGEARILVVEHEGSI